MVRFIVDKNGNVSSIRTLTNFGYGMEAEVVRVIAKGPNWIPAKQNGHIVNAYQTQPVTFEIKEGVKKDVPAITTSQNQPNSLPNYPKISVNEIQKATAYDLTWVEPGAEISSFILSSDNDAGTIDDVPNYGNSLNTRVKELIGSTKPGRTITIDKINIVKNGKSEKLPSKVYFVTN